jgi:hypothetical protein
MSALPAILEYGLTGLAAIIVFLAYRLLQQESETEAPRPAMLQTIKAFMALGVVLAVVSAASNYIELRSASGAQLAAVRDICELDPDAAKTTMPWGVQALVRSVLEERSAEDDA